MGSKRGTPPLKWHFSLNMLRVMRTHRPLYPRTMQTYSVKTCKIEKNGHSTMTRLRVGAIHNSWSKWLITPAPPTSPRNPPPKLRISQNGRYKLYVSSAPPLPPLPGGDRCGGDGRESWGSRSELETTKEVTHSVEGRTASSPQSQVLPWV